MILLCYSMQTTFLIMDLFFATIPKIFDRAIVAKQLFLKYIIVPTGICTLPALIVSRFLYVYVFKYLIDHIWNIMCRLYLYLVDLYLRIGSFEPPRIRPHSSHRMETLHHE